MADIIRSAIAAGGYRLAEMTKKINVLWTTGFLTDEERDELLALAAEHADTETERPSEQAMLEALAERVTKLEEKVTALVGDASDAPEYPAWKPWDGMSRDYQKGAIVTHKGELWRSVFEGQNVWEPGPAGTESLWVKYTPGAKEE